MVCPANTTSAFPRRPMPAISRTPWRCWTSRANGTWIGTTGVLSYWPREGEDLTRAEVVAPVVQNTLLAVQGTPERPVRNLHFRGIRVAHVDWPLPPYGFAAMFGCLQMLEQTDPEPAKKFTWIDAAVSFKHARSCEFSRRGGRARGRDRHQPAQRLHRERDRRQRASTTWAAEASRPAGSATATPGSGPTRWQPDDHQGYRIANNHVHDCGLDYFGSIGIFLGRPRSRSSPTT